MFGDTLNQNGIILLKIKKINQIFFFLLTKIKNIQKENDLYSIGCYPEEGPKFGWGPQIGFIDGNLRKGRYIKSDDNSFVLNNPFTNGKENWKLKNQKYIK